MKVLSGRLEEITRFLAEHSAGRIFLVTGRSSYHDSGCEERLGKVLAGYQVRRFCDFGPNPGIDDVNRGLELFRQFAPDAVIAAGGGSVIDTAKTINLWAANAVQHGEFFEGSREGAERGCPLAAVPTTAGSGSEATAFATIYVGKTKRSVEHPDILPDYVILDPTVTTSLPPDVTASSGVDALGHALESYWSIRSTGESKEYARRAIGLILPNLPIAVRRPDPEARAAMLEAAHLAGRAINLTRTTAAHAVSYALTSHFHIPHGHAVALSLPSLFAYNAAVTTEDVLDPRGAGYVRETMRELSALLGAESIDEARKTIEGIMEETGLERRLRPFGVEEADIERISDTGFDPSRAGNNPRHFSGKAVREMLLEIL